MVFNEDRKGVNGLLLVHLAEGPTAHFKISNLVLGRDIKARRRAPRAARLAPPRLAFPLRGGAGRAAAPGARGRRRERPPPSPRHGPLFPGPRPRDGPPPRAHPKPL